MLVSSSEMAIRVVGMFSKNFPSSAIVRAIKSKGIVLT